MPVPIHRALAGTRASGNPLPEVGALKGLYDLKVRPLRGQVTMIAGQPGSQKSGFTMWLCQQMGVPALYFAFDMAKATVFTRMASMVSGDDGDTVVEGLRSGAEDFYSDQLSESKVHFVFGTDGDMGEVALELDAWVEMYDTYPAVIVIDNLMDCVGEAEDANASYQEAMKEMTRLARYTGAAVFVLHHMSESVGDGTEPSPRKALQMKVGQKPEVILSVALNTKLEYMIAPVKNRNGFQDQTGKTYVTLQAEPERTRFHAMGNFIPRQRSY